MATVTNLAAARTILVAAAGEANGGVFAAVAVRIGLRVQ
jgi:hypothetical protein